MNKPEHTVGQRKVMAVIWGIVAFFVANIGASAVGLSGQIMPGVVAGFAVWWFFSSELRPGRVFVKEPPAHRYKLQRDVVVGILKETVPNINFEDRWWTLHWFNKDRGEMKFRVNYDPAQSKGEKEKQQIILDAYIKRDEDSASSIVILRYEYTQNTSEDRALEMIEHTTESIEYKLRAAEAGRV